MIKKGWGDTEGLVIIDLSPNTFLFNFPNFEIPNRILDEAPWNILEQALILKKWHPQISMHEVEFSHTPYWVQMHGFPLEFFSKDNIVKTGRKLGEVLEVEDPFHGTTISRGFLHTKISINVKNPLVAGFWLPRSTLPRM